MMSDFSRPEGVWGVHLGADEAELEWTRCYLAEQQAKIKAEEGGE